MLAQIKQTLKIINLIIVIVFVMILTLPKTVLANNTERRLYYSQVLKKFLAQGKKNIVVMLKDIDNDGEEELITYWQDEIYDEDFGREFPQTIYKLDVYDMKDSKKLHFAEEKLDFYRHANGQSIFITDKGYLAFYHHGSDIAQQTGWVYDSSKKYEISGGIYHSSSPDEEATFNGNNITQKQFEEKREYYGLPHDYDYQGDDMTIISYSAGVSIFPYKNTQNDISILTNTTTSKEVLSNYKTVNITMNNKKLNINPPAIIKNNTALVPARKISDLIGATLGWDEKTKTITIKLDGKTVKLTIDNTTMYIDDKPSKIVLPAQIIESSSYIPLQAMILAFGTTFSYDDKTATINIIKDFNIVEKYNVQSSVKSQEMPSIQLANLVGNFNIAYGENYQYYVTNYTTKANSIDGWTDVTFDVWNASAKYGTVIVLDESGNEIVKQRQFIDIFRPNISGMEGILDYLGRFKYLNFSDDNFRLTTKQTQITCTVPIGGSIIITNDTTVDGLLCIMDYLVFAASVQKEVMELFDEATDLKNGRSEASIRAIFVDAIQNDDKLLKKIKENWTPDIARAALVKNADKDGIKFALENIDSIVKKINVWDTLSKTETWYSLGCDFVDGTINDIPIYGLAYNINNRLWGYANVLEHYSATKNAAGKGSVRIVF